MKQDKTGLPRHSFNDGGDDFFPDLALGGDATENRPPPDTPSPTFIVKSGAG